MLNIERTGTGKPLVLVHGLGSSVRTWDPVLPLLQEQHEVIAIDLSGFGSSEPLAGGVTIANLTNAVEQFLEQENLRDADIVGSSMGARTMVELARRGHANNAVALDPGGFWNDTQVRIFNGSITASIALVQRRPARPAVTRPAGCGPDGAARPGESDARRTTAVGVLALGVSRRHVLALRLRGCVLSFYTVQAPHGFGTERHNPDTGHDQISAGR